MEIEEIWKTIENFFESNDTAAFEELSSCKGATDQEIEAAEKRIGYFLPDDLKRSLKCHDIDVVISDYEYSSPLRSLKNYGYALPLEQMVSKYVKHNGGAKKSKRTELDGLLPIFEYDEDQNYFFMFVHLTSGLVCYVDYGDLISDPIGQVVAWNFKDFLQSFATNLIAGKLAENSLGLHGHEDLMALMPTARILEEGIPIRKAIEQAIAKPTENIKESVKIGAINELPLPVGVNLLQELKWKVDNTSEYVINTGKSVESSTHGFSASGDIKILRNSEKCYWEVMLDDYVYVPGIGIRSEPEDWSITWRGDEISLLRNNCSYSSQYTFPNDNATRYENLKSAFKKGSVIGVMLDMKTLEIEFYFNRKPVGEVVSMVTLFEDPWEKKKQKLDEEKLFQCVVPFATTATRGHKFVFYM